MDKKKKEESAVRVILLDGVFVFIPRSDLGFPRKISYKIRSFLLMHAVLYSAQSRIRKTDKQ